MKKLIVKNVIIIGIIILVACFFTYKIYNRFHKERSVDYTSSSLDITFHDKSGEKISITKVTPLSDNLGLSGKPYDFSIKNNLTEPVKVTIKLVDDNETIEKDNCIESSIPKEYIKVSIKENNGKNEVYTMSELTDNILLETEIKALDEQNYTVRVWVASEIETTNFDLHYHGKIQIIENDSILARR